MIELFIFRLLLVCAFIIGVYSFGDWKNLQSYYPTMLFVMVVNLTSSLLTYHHILWGFGPDFFVTTSTVVELLNSYIALPATVFIFLSRFPSSGRCCSFFLCKNSSFKTLLGLVYHILVSSDHIICI